MATLKDLEVSPEGTQVPLADVIDQLKFNNDGLIPAIAQDHDSGAVLMLAWMDRHAIQRTLAEGQVVYYSRSRQDILAQRRNLRPFSRSGQHAL